MASKATTAPIPRPSVASPTTTPTRIKRIVRAKAPMTSPPSPAAIAAPYGYRRPSLGRAGRVLELRQDRYLHQVDLPSLYDDAVAQLGQDGKEQSDHQCRQEPAPEDGRDSGLCGLAGYFGGDNDLVAIAERRLGGIEVDACRADRVAQGRVLADGRLQLSADGRVDPDGVAQELHDIGRKYFIAARGRGRCGRRAAAGTCRGIGAGDGGPLFDRLLEAVDLGPQRR